MHSSQDASDIVADRSAEAREAGNLEGVRGAAQLLYVRLYGELLREGSARLNAALLAPPTLTLHAMKLEHAPACQAGDEDLWLSVLIDRGHNHADVAIAFPASTPLAECAHAETIGTLFDCTLAPPPPELGEIDDSPWTTALCGDVKVQLFAHRGRRAHGDGGQLPAPTLVGFTWFHTSLLAVDESGVATIPLEHIDLAESGAWCREKLEGMVLRLGWKEGALSGSAGGPALANPLWSEEGVKAEL